MPAADPSSPLPRGQKTICIPCSPEEYHQVVGDPEWFLDFLDRHIEATPELFPAEIRRGYRKKDLYRSRMTGCELRRIELRNLPCGGHAIRGRAFTWDA
jgi:hypothetical protein